MLGVRFRFKVDKKWSIFVDDYEEDNPLRCYIGDTTLRPDVRPHTSLYYYILCDLLDHADRLAGDVYDELLDKQEIKAMWRRRRIKNFVVRQGKRLIDQYIKFVKGFYAVTGLRFTLSCDFLWRLMSRIYKLVHRGWFLKRVVYFFSSIGFSKIIGVLTYVPRAFYTSLLNFVRLNGWPFFLITLGFTLMTVVSFAFVFIPMAEFALYLADMFQWIGMGKRDRLAVMPYIFIACTFLLSFKFLAWYSPRCQDLYEDVKYQWFMYWYFLNQHIEFVLLENYLCPSRRSCRKE